MSSPEPVSPSARTDEIEQAVRQFPEIQKDNETFEAIIHHLGLQKIAAFGDAEKLLVYRDYEKLQAIHLEPRGERFKVTIDRAGSPPSCTEKVSPCSDAFIDSQGQIMAMGMMEPVRHDIPPPPMEEIKPTPNLEGFPSLRIEKLLAPELRYRILQEFGALFFCDPDRYPRGRDEMPEAVKAFPEIQKDIDTFRAITKNYGLEKITELSDIQKLIVYTEYKKLSAIRLEALGEKYKFSIRARNDSSGPNSRNNGFAIDGLVDQKKQITVLKKEPTFLTCPMCLAGSTQIDTPAGPVAVKDLKKGMLVWTLDGQAERVAQPVLKTSSVSVPLDHLLIHLVLKDGRELWASPQHPTVDGRTVTQLEQNAVYDGATVAYAELVPNEDTKTYDLLPAGDTGFYWANGILLASTLRNGFQRQVYRHVANTSRHAAIPQLDFSVVPLRPQELPFNILVLPFPE
jgi:hypothetical protein